MIGATFTGRATMLSRLDRGPLLMAILSVMLMLFAGTSSAVVFEPREFSSAQHEARYRQLNEELRCLVCQNQNIAGSDAALAQDLRREVYRMLNEGLTDEQIVDYMVQRYGDFVLYRPPLSPLTVALWTGPFVLLLLGMIFLWRIMSRRQASAVEQTPLSKEERERLRKLVSR